MRPASALCWVSVPVAVALSSCGGETSEGHPQTRDAGAPDVTLRGADGGVDAHESSRLTDGFSLNPGDGAADTLDGSDDDDSAPADGGAFFDGNCTLEAAAPVFDAGRFPDCTHDPCGPGHFCINFEDNPGAPNGVVSAMCAAIPQECTCTPTCACIGTWWTPTLELQCYVDACAVGHEQVVIGCRDTGK